jgi:hypothetical protein
MPAASGVPVEAQVQNAVMIQFIHAVEQGTMGGSGSGSFVVVRRVLDRPAVLLEMAEAARD